MENYKIEEFLGKGAFGTVVRAIDKEQNQTVYFNFIVTQF